MGGREFTVIEAYEGEYLTEKAVWLKAGRYEAVMLPVIGGNLAAFRNTVDGHRYLHEPGPEDWEAFRARPLQHGIPVLFPPNRYEDGKIPWNGQTYQLPVNETLENNHLHGFLYNIPWKLQSYGTTQEQAYVTVSISVDRHHPIYAHFPHEFTVQLRYSLSEQGLEQRVSVRNEGPEEMPCMLGFHTAVNAPFTEGGSAEHCRMKMTIGKRWKLNGRMLPTGEQLELSETEREMKDGGIYPFGEVMDNHYTAEPHEELNRMELTDRRTGVKLVYETGRSFKQWMIWNNFGNEGFFCPEPQTSLVNAPNVNLSYQETGLISLTPGETWEETSRLYSVSE
jgi:aldose 1-epimerase